MGTMECYAKVGMQELDQRLAKIVEAARKQPVSVYRYQALHGQAQALVASSNAQLGQYKQAYDELLGMTKAKESERARLALSLGERDSQVLQCSAQNQKMYAVAKGILEVYERIDVADVMKVRQPFAGSARVKFEELAQAFGDQLYQTQFDAAQGSASQQAN